MLVNYPTKRKQPPCPDCKEMMHAIRCEGSPKIFGLNVLPYDVMPGLPNRTLGKGSLNNKHTKYIINLIYKENIHCVDTELDLYADTKLK